MPEKLNLAQKEISEDHYLLALLLLNAFEFWLFSVTIWEWFFHNKPAQFPATILIIVILLALIPFLVLDYALEKMHYSVKKSV